MANVVSETVDPLVTWVWSEKLNRLVIRYAITPMTVKLMPIVKIVSVATTLRDAATAAGNA